MGVESMKKMWDGIGNVYSVYIKEKRRLSELLDALDKGVEDRGWSAIDR
jgi:hypothetical protein